MKTQFTPDRNDNFPLITLDSITLRVNGKLMFQGTDWNIRANQQWAIIGSNGSGKSILASAIMRSVPITQGQILYYFAQKSGNNNQPRTYFDQGEIVMISPESHRSLVRHHGYHQARWNSMEGIDVPKVSDLLSGRSIERFLPYQVDQTRIAEDIYRKRRDDAVQTLGIEYLLERKILHLSNGEVRKVLMTRALMQSPRLLILDDPFCGLDNDSRQTLKNAINDLFSAGNLRILLITARLDEIPPGITHILRVADRRVVEKGLKEMILKPGLEQKIFGQTEPAQQPAGLDFPITPRAQVASSSILIEMKKVSVSYGQVQVLQGLTWVMKQGENWAVLGPNGAGKSTLLSLILADNPQSYSNEITLFGRKRGSGETVWEIKQKIGWVAPELHTFYNRGISCLKVVCSGFFDSVGLYQECSDQVRSKADKWLHALGIDDLAHRSFGSVSVGEQRLVLLARALVKNPLLLILDEPCQGLDLNHRTTIIKLLDRLCQQADVNLIYVTHHFDEMPAAITHVLQLNKGRIQEKGFRRNILGN